MILSTGAGSSDAPGSRGAGSSPGIPESVTAAQIHHEAGTQHVVVITKSLLTSETLQTHSGF